MHGPKLDSDDALLHVVRVSLDVVLNFPDAVQRQIFLLSRPGLLIELLPSDLHRLCFCLTNSLGRCLEPLLIPKFPAASPKQHSSPLPTLAPPQRSPFPKPPSQPATMSDTEPRSRSQSRRSRRRKQASQKEQQQQSMPPVAEQSSDEDDKAMQPFERIGPPSTSMNGPVTNARAQRGEIPMRDGNAKQALATGEGEKSGTSKMMEQDGLKLRLELNLDIEIELKASIHGDLTLALL